MLCYRGILLYFPSRHGLSGFAIPEAAGSRAAEAQQMAAGEGSVPPGRGAEGVPPRPDSRRPRARCRRGGCGRRKAPVVRAASGPSSTPTPGGATPSARPVSRPWPRGRRPPLRLTAPAFGGEWVELRSAVS